jgi:phage N-6-adenine-methyltransferase
MHGQNHNDRVAWRGASVIGDNRGLAMSDPIAIVQCAVDPEAERGLIKAELTTLRLAEQKGDKSRAVIGASLLRMRGIFPERGPKAKGWGEFLASVELEQRTAYNYMEFARRVSETVSETQPDPPATYADVGMDNRPRKGDAAEPDPPPPYVPHETGVPCQPPRAHVSNNTGNNEWYTPPEYLEAARVVMGGIDLDPASSEIANRAVDASRFYTEDDNGLEQPWAGRVWMNPPYAQPLISHFCERVAASYEAEEISAAIVLVNNGTETKWGQRLLGASSAVCFPSGRIRFVDPEGNPGGAPLQGQMVAYLGSDPQLFSSVFGELGVCLIR